MATSINPSSTPPQRRKAHKGGKIVSLSVMWIGLIFVIFLAIGQAISVLAGKTADYTNRDVASFQGTELQPLAAKIVSADSESKVTSLLTGGADYADVWSKLEHLVPKDATKEQREATIVAFLDGLNYQMTTYGGTIVSKTTGSPINPSTMDCYLNGYIPDKPYIKANCPTF